MPSSAPHAAPALLSAQSFSDGWRPGRKFCATSVPYDSSAGSAQASSSAGSVANPLRRAAISSSAPSGR